MFGYLLASVSSSVGTESVGTSVCTKGCSFNETSDVVKGDSCIETSGVVEGNSCRGIFRVLVGVGR